MIATRTEIKTLLQITGTTYDTLIDTLIPIVTNDIIETCNNNFTDIAVKCELETISFTLTGNIIADSDSGFGDYEFYNGMDICVLGSYNNDGHYTVTSVSASQIVTTENLVVNEAEGQEVSIIKVVWPKDLKMTFAKMINYHIKQATNTGVQSEGIGDYNVSYFGGADYINGYPKNVIDGLRKYMLPKIW